MLILSNALKYTCSSFKTWKVGSVKLEIQVRASCVKSACTLGVCVANTCNGAIKRSEIYLQ